MKGDSLSSILPDPSVAKTLEVLEGSLTADDLALNMTNLVKFTHSKTVLDEVPPNCFEKRASLQAVSINVEQKIGDLSFSHCPALSDFSVIGQPIISETAFQGSGIKRFYAPNINTSQRIFKDVPTLESASFPNMTLIQEKFFSQLPYLTEAILSKDPIIVEYNAFGECGLQKFPDFNYEKIGSYTFEKCQFTDVVLKGNPSLGSQLFLNGQLETFSAPDLKSMEYYLFPGCSNLTTISVPLISALPKGFAMELVKLTSVTLSETEPICAEAQAFESCISLPWINWTFSHIGDKTFRNCTSFTNVFVAGNPTFGYDSFQESSLETFEAPEVEAIGDIFTWCKNLWSIRIPLVVEIPQNFAKGLDKLTTFVASPKPIWVQYGAFSGCHSLPWLNRTFSRLETHAFQDCRFQDVYIIGYPSIFSAAFSGCPIINFTAPDVEKIGQDALEGCLLLERLILPKVSVIEQFFLKDRTSLETVVLSSTEPIFVGMSSFQGCISLPWPNWNFRYIGTQAFFGCNFHEVTLNGEPELGNFIFNRCTIVNFTAPDLKKLVPNTFIECPNLKRVFMPSCIEVLPRTFEESFSLMTVVLSEKDSVVIGRKAFAECYSLDFPIAKYGKIEEDAFLNCHFKKISLGNEVDIDPDAFSGCTRAVEFIENGIATIDFAITFPDCPFQVIVLNTSTKVTNLPKSTQIFRGNAITELENKRLFKNLDQLEQVFLPSLTTLDFPFTKCPRLTNAVLKKVTTISGQQHFAGTNLSHVCFCGLKIVPKDSLLFGDCKLHSICLPPNPPSTFNQDMFSSCLDCILDIPEGSESTYDDNTAIEGDVAGDGKWCGLKIKGIVPTTITTTEEAPDSKSHVSKQTIVIASSISVAVVIVAVAVIIVFYKRKQAALMSLNTIEDPLNSQYTKYQ